MGKKNQNLLLGVGKKIINELPTLFRLILYVDFFSYLQGNIMNGDTIFRYLFLCSYFIAQSEMCLRFKKVAYMYQRHFILNFILFYSCIKVIAEHF